MKSDEEDVARMEADGAPAHEKRPARKPAAAKPAPEVKKAPEATKPPAEELEQRLYLADKETVLEHRPAEHPGLVSAKPMGEYDVDRELDDLWPLRHDYDQE